MRGDGGSTLIAVSLVFGLLKFAGMHWPALGIFHLREGMFNPGNAEFIAWIVWGWAAARYLLSLASVDAPVRMLLGWRVWVTIAISLLPLAISWFRISSYALHLLDDTGIAI